MRTPPFLLGASLLFWGWQTGMPWIAAAAAVWLEAAHLLKVRWSFAQADLDRIWNLCVALFLGATIYTFFSGDNLTAVTELLKDNSPSSRLATLNQSKQSLFQLVQWLPFMFFPIAVAQVYSQEERFDLSTFSWWLRRQRRHPGRRQEFQNLGVNLEYPFFACCLFSASAANKRSLWFTAGLLALVIWPLWLHRPKSFRAPAWIASLMLALVLGVAMQSGAFQLQQLLQRLDEALLARWSSGRTLSAKENQTHLGAVGRLKLSGRIVLQVDPHGRNPPRLLREASYDLFRSPLWSASKLEFDSVTPDTNQAAWALRTNNALSQVVSIAGYLPGGNGLLPLPNSVTRLDQLPALNIMTNAFGSVRVEEGPGFVDFQAAFGDGPAIDSLPTNEDYQVLMPELSAVQEIAAALELDRVDSDEAIRRVEQFFARNFTYSTWQPPQYRSRRHRSALARFLLETHSGHCEYFATATTLLLRVANIPARYAVGYSVQEKHGRHYVVRERHAHAWCLAWVNDAWRDVDTTPAAWGDAEATRASVWEPFRDFFSTVWFEFSRWRWGHTGWKHYLLWLILPVLALTMGKLLLQGQWRRSSSSSGGRNVRLWPGVDSEFYQVERKLAAAGLRRQPGETGSAWLERIEHTNPSLVDGLKALLRYHYRVRFDPVGLTAAERQELRRCAETWLQRKEINPKPEFRGSK